MWQRLQGVNEVAGGFGKVAPAAWVGSPSEGHAERDENDVVCGKATAGGSVWGGQVASAECSIPVRLYDVDGYGRMTHPGGHNVVDDALEAKPEHYWGEVLHLDA